MPGPVSYTKATLSYPLYSVDFDPYDRGFLVVGGGGGEGRSGVGNKLVRVFELLDRQFELTEA
jgi:prolactin regulatory element-binding protein